MAENQDGSIVDQHNETESANPLKLGEKTYSQSVESIALWALLITGTIMFIVVFAVNIDRESVPIIPDRGSVGFQGLIASMLVSLFLTPYAYVKSAAYRNQSLPVEIQTKYKWFVVPVTIAVTIFIAFGASLFFEFITRSFEGLELRRLSAAIWIGSMIGILSYILVSWIMRMRNSSFVYIAIFSLFATILAAGAANENPMWYENSFSYLGMTESNSNFIFNLGLPFTGLLIVIWSIYFTEFLNVLLSAGVITPKTKTIIHTVIVLTGILLSLVGIVRFGIGPIGNIIHDVAATGMGVVLGVLMLIMHRLIKVFPRVFYYYSYGSIVLIVSSVVLMIGGVVSLTGLEMVAFVMAGFWLIVFYRNVDQLTALIKPDIRL